MIARRVLMCVLFFGLAASASAAEIPFQGFERGIELAKAQGKTVYVLFGSGFCSWCLKQKEVLSEEATDVAAQHVMVYVDIAEHDAVASRYGVKVVPVNMILNADGKVLRRHTGFLDRRQFRRWVLEE